VTRFDMSHGSFTRRNDRGVRECDMTHFDVSYASFEWVTKYSRRTCDSF